MKTVLSLGLAAALSTSAPGAAAANWTFTFTNLCADIGCVDLNGQFSGVDSNGDGTIALDELTLLEIDTARFFPAWTSAPGDLPAAGSTFAFSYVMGGPLSFSAGAYYYRVQVSVTTGTDYIIFGPVPESGTYAWTPQTTQVVTAVVVPEPGTAALLALGLLTLGARAPRTPLDPWSASSSQRTGQPP